MLILAVDATTFRQSIAFVQDGQVLAEVRLASKSAHSRRLLPAVDFAVHMIEVKPADIDGYAVTMGPGSFTGVRVGLSTIQGLALAAGKPVIGMTSLDVLAAKARGDADAIVAIIDSERGEVYAGAYDRDARPTREPASAPLDHVLDAMPEDALFIGDGAEKHQAAIRSRRPNARFSTRSSFLAATLGREAEPRLKNGEGIHPRDLRPLYLRGAHLWGQKPA